MSRHLQLEMETITDRMDQHPNYTIASVRNRFRKVNATSYIRRFKKYIGQDGTRVEKLGMEQLHLSSMRWSCPKSSRLSELEMLASSFHVS